MARSHSEPATVRFYQLAAMPLETALLGIVGKAWERGIRINLLAGDGAQAQRLDDLFWIQPPFLPHGLWNGPDPEQQPLLISLEPDLRNQATLLVLATPRLLPESGGVAMIIDFLPGHDPAALARGRDRYRHYRSLGCRMEYWQQNPRGGWQLHGQQDATRPDQAASQLIEDVAGNNCK
ncbi:MAG: DNA polymerase III subunit chi [Magnetococcales bacterium]|nr:DNA polymerase III subunit chi [Magnetococcales bacterium]